MPTGLGGPFCLVSPFEADIDITQVNIIGTVVLAAVDERASYMYYTCNSLAQVDYRADQ